MKIGLFYGSTTCYTEMAAEKIRSIIGEDLVDIHNVKETPLSLMADYDLLLIGISTWDFGEIQEDWNEIWQDISSTPLKGKVVALFGLGDQVNYSEWFLDAMGMLFDELQNKGATFIGQWPNQGYDFVASKALNEAGTEFVGLALDEDNQYNESDTRISSWCQQINVEINDVLTS